MPGGDIGVVNLYAPNEHGLRVRLWESLISELPANCHWIVAGDFNMVESSQDKTNPYEHLIPIAKDLSSK
jgi:endonuclease/exonuclease/phosphatase family metal-dependent hydrolase